MSIRVTEGFTLLELLLVLTIMAMAAVLVLPTVSGGLGHWRMQAAVREVSTLAKFARNQSVARAQRLQLVIDRPRRLYWLDNEPPTLSDPDAADRHGIRLYALPPGVQFGEAAIGETPIEQERVGFVFFPRGDSSGGELRLVDERGAGYRLVFDSLTGRVDVRP
jgi:prepilin-type N-terminal cleavage/methylation domain-containing protein